MTVSRALNRPARRQRRTSEALRQRILAAGEPHGYLINPTACTFSSQRCGFVAALIPSLNNRNFSEAAQGITAAIAPSAHRPATAAGHVG